MAAEMRQKRDTIREQSVTEGRNDICRGETNRKKKKEVSQRLCGLNVSFPFCVIITGDGADGGGEING